jgi:uncharacterized membrane protein YfcA
VAPLTLQTALLLFTAAVLGGAMNAVAGGGTFIAFPALVFSGVPPINANATNTVALWPGIAASVGAYRVELAKQQRSFVLWMGAISLLGGILGAVLLLRTPEATFSRLVPYLLLGATALFTFSRPLTSRFRGKDVTLGGHGYFGGGIGILMLAALGLLGMENIHEMNALKTLFGTCINGVAVLTFIAAGIVAWPQALIMLVGAIIGGYGCASFARRVDPRWVRRFVIAVGTAMSVYFFLR